MYIELFLDLKYFNCLWHRQLWARCRNNNCIGSPSLSLPPDPRSLGALPADLLALLVQPVSEHLGDAGVQQGPGDWLETGEGVDCCSIPHRSWSTKKGLFWQWINSQLIPRVLYQAFDIRSDLLGRIAQRTLALPLQRPRQQLTKALVSDRGLEGGLWAQSKGKLLTLQLLGALRWYQWGGIGHGSLPLGLGFLINLGHTRY